MKGRPLSYWQGGSSFRTFCRIRPVVPSLKRSCRKEARHARRSGSCKAKGFPRPALFRGSSQAGHSGSPSPGGASGKGSKTVHSGTRRGKAVHPEKETRRKTLLRKACSEKCAQPPPGKRLQKLPIQKASGKKFTHKNLIRKSLFRGRRFFLARIPRQKWLPCACCRSRGLCPARFHSRQAQFLNNLWQVRTENAF